MSVIITLADDVARELQDSMSDLACWGRGFVTALPPDDRPHYSPLGLSAVVDINIILKGALRDLDEGKLSPVEAQNARLRRWLYRLREEFGGVDHSLIKQALSAALDGAEPPDGTGLEGWRMPA